MSKPGTQSDGRIRAAWWYDLIWSVLFLLAAYGAYRYFLWYESTDESVLMWAPIAIAYRLTGKWGVVVLACLLSVVCLRSGVRKLKGASKPQS